MSESGIDAKLLHDLIVASSKANESMKNSLNTVGESLESLVDYAVETKATMEAIKSERRTFYQYAVKTFVWVFAILLMVIGTLLWELNVTGADTVSKVPAAVLKIIR